MEAKYEKLGRLIDSLESLAYGLALPIPSQFHIDQLKKILPQQINEFKKSFIEITGENPWD
ncbi:MAG: hypothetical protein M0P47_09230 [Bacteroidales bacterium]|jgi:hypothetical protein|nr:hypothetical protein [Bacteroidales bacterium]